MKIEKLTTLKRKNIKCLDRRTMVLNSANIGNFININKFIVHVKNTAWQFSGAHTYIINQFR